MEMGNSLQKYKWILYCTVCDKNGKIYIGVHKTKNPDKFDGYIGGGWEVGWEIKHPKTAYEFALKKYGYSSFKRFTFYVTDNEQDAYDLERKIVNPEFIKNKNNYNTHLGGKGGGKPKKFYQYDLQGNFIKEWNSGFEILDFFNCDDSGRITRAVKEKWNTFGFFWSDKKYDKLPNGYRFNKFSELYTYDINGNLLKVYKQAEEIAKDLKVSLNFIYEGLNKKLPVKEIFIVRNPADIFNTIKIWEIKKNQLKDGCVSYYKDGKIIKTFPDLKKLSKELNISTKDLKNALSTGNEINGFKFAYGFNENYKVNENPKIKVAQYDLDGNLIKIYESLSACSKDHPKFRLVLQGVRNQTHNSTFKIVS